MHSIQFQSPGQMISRLLGKQAHAERRPRTKAAARASKRRMREYRDAIAQVVWGPNRKGIEL